MYYMSGNKLGMGGRYSVDPEELERLQEMSKVRREAAHYGRGLRYYTSAQLHCFYMLFMGRVDACCSLMAP